MKLTDVLIERMMEKKAASPTTDYVGEVTSNVLLSGIPGIVGGIAGLTDDALTPNERLESYKRSTSKGFIPGVGAYRNMQRRKSLSKELGKSSYRKVISELLGPAIRNTVVLGPAGLGLTAGENIVGGIGALLTKRRTKADQEKYERSGKAEAANWLLPSAGAYNFFKSLGYLQGEANSVK